MHCVHQDYESFEELTEKYKKLTVESGGLPDYNNMIECSICKEQSCTERMFVYGYRDIFGCSECCMHEDKTFIPTNLFINVNMINKLCCNCIDN